jgi:hypothetical protein
VHTALAASLLLIAELGLLAQFSMWLTGESSDGGLFLSTGATGSCASLLPAAWMATPRPSLELSVDSNHHLLAGNYPWRRHRLDGVHRDNHVRPLSSVAYPRGLKSRLLLSSVVPAIMALIYSTCTASIKSITSISLTDWTMHRESMNSPDVPIGVRCASC